VNTATNCTLNTLSEGATYYFAVTAYDTSGNESGFSNEVSKIVTQSNNTTNDSKPSVSPSPVPISDGLVAFWGMNEGGGKILYDASGNNHSAIFGHNGVASDPTWDFDNENDEVVAISGADWYQNKGNYIDLGPIDISGNQMSIGILFKAGSLTPDDGRLISKQFGRSENEHYWMLSRFSSGRLRFRLRTGGSVTTLISSQSNLYRSGEWVFAVATYDGSFMRLYCNGMEVGKVAKSGMINADSSIKAYIGAAIDGNMLSATFDGKIDYAFIYDRALSGDEISQFNSNGEALVASELEPGDSVDTISPTVNIISPSSTGSLETSDSAVNFAGTASDNVGVTQVAWSNDRGGSGTASGTASWKASNIQLSAGTNILTFTARDAAGNQGSKTLAVTYDAPDTSAPTVSLSTPTSSGSYATGTSALTVSGTATDNVGVTQVAWSNDRGGSGTASGTASWKASNIQLSAGTNILTFTARDAANNLSSKTLAVTYDAPDTSAPTVSLSTPTSSGSYATESAAMMVTGTATDNVGVTQVAWSNDRGGSGTEPINDNGSWTVGNIALYEGTNNLTFEARDAAGNQGSKTLAVTYTAPVQASSDQVAPAVRIVSPTTQSNYFSRIRSVDLAGTAFDNIQVAKITWKNSRGESGTASGTQNWAVAGIPLNRWRNTVTITAHDAAGNTSSANLWVFCWR
jgi:hypothetical protein